MLSKVREKSVPLTSTGLPGWAAHAMSSWVPGSLVVVAAMLLLSNLRQQHVNNNLIVNMSNLRLLVSTAPVTYCRAARRLSDSKVRVESANCTSGLPGVGSPRVLFVWSPRLPSRHRHVTWHVVVVSGISAPSGCSGYGLQRLRFSLCPSIMF